MKRSILIICLLNTFIATAQKTGYTERANAYIQQYSDWAIEEQLRSGIPASITLAQGIYETGAGESKLATQANNHFGIKCKKEWKGQTFAHTDDAPNECFRKYSCAKDSYKDHSDYLKNSPRYASLFMLEPTDYAAWAKGLKRCGYATNPLYAQKLVKTVEDFGLQQFTLAALNQRPAEVVPERDLVQPAVYKVPAKPRSTVTEVVYQTSETGVQLVNGIRAIYCRKGETLLDKAMKYNVRYARLLEINELSDEPLPRDMFIYLEKLNNKGAHATYTVKEGETVEFIAHEEGMSSRQLRVFNLLTKDEQPVAGSVLKLQQQSEERPATYLAARNQKQVVNGNVRLLNPNSRQEDNDYLPTRRTAAAADTEEISIGYGAERPEPVVQQLPASRQNLPVSAPPVQTQPVQQAAAQPQPATAPVARTVEAPAARAMPAAEPTTKVVSVEEPQDELSRLKAKLDRAVYARSSPSNIKVTRNDEETIGPEPVAPAPKPQVSSVGPDPAGAQYHTVQKGETAYSIAQKYQVGMKQLREWNNLNFESIKVGQKLRVR